MIIAVIIMMRVKQLIVIIVVRIAQTLFLGGMFCLFAEQRFAILFRNLIIVRVNFAERQKTMAIAAIINKRCL